MKGFPFGMTKTIFLTKTFWQYNLKKEPLPTTGRELAFTQFMNNKLVLLMTHVLEPEEAVEFNLLAMKNL